MSLFNKTKTFGKMILGMMTQPRLRESYLQMTDALYGQPEPLQQQFAQWPAALRGFSYAQGWRESSAQGGPQTPMKSGAIPESGRLKAYFDAHKDGRGIWKWQHYFEIYERHFHKFVGHEVHVMEIGIYSGGSLEMWRDYFGTGCRVYGVDIQAACKSYEDEHTRIFIGDQADRKFWAGVRAQVPRIDILIDDGGHEPEQQIATLEEMLPHISPGGVYLCEDIHGVDNSFLAYLHGLVDSLNEIQGDALGGVQPTPFQGWIRSIEFGPYIATIEKADLPEQKFIAPKHGTQWQPFL